MSDNLPISKQEFISSAKHVVANYDEVADELNAIVRYYVRGFNTAVRARENGRIEAARKREYTLVTSTAAKIVCLVVALHVRRSKHSTRMHFDNIKRLAKLINPRVAIDEPVRAFWQRKASGGRRPLAKLGLMRRANTNMARMMACMRSSRSLFEFAVKGCGRDAAATAIIKEIEKGGDYVAIADVQDAYGSITEKTVEELKLLPASVICNTVFLPACAPVKSYNNDNDLSSALRRGMIQGSRVSPIVQQKLIEHVLLQVDAGFACSYGDDIALLAASREEAAAKLDALESIFAARPGGALKLKTKDVCKVGEHMNYCGYWFRPRNPEYGGGARVTPSNEAIRRFYIRLAKKLIWTLPREEDADTETYAINWSNSHGCWTGAKIGREIAIAEYQLSIEPRIMKAMDQVRKERRSFESFRELHDYLEAVTTACIPDWVILKNWPPTH